MAEMDPAERLLAHHLGGAARAFVGRIPQSVNVALPLPPDARLIGTVVMGRDDDPDAVHLYLESTKTPDATMTFFDDALGNLGFRQTEPTQPRQAQGFVPSRSGMEGVTRLYCRGDSGPHYRLFVRAAGSNLVVLLQWNSGHLGFSPCAKEAPSHLGPPGLEKLPMLEGPESVPIQGGGGGGNPDQWTSYGSAFTKLAARDLLDHFIPQLERQNVVVEDRGVAGPAAWCRGRVADEDRTVFLFIFEQSEALRHLTLVSMTPHAERNIRRMYGSGWGARVY